MRRTRPGVLQRLEVLADGGVGQVELGRQLAGGRRVDALQPLDEASLGIGHVDHATPSSTDYTSDFFDKDFEPERAAP